MKYGLSMREVKEGMAKEKVELDKIDFEVYIKEGISVYEMIERVLKDNGYSIDYYSEYELADYIATRYNRNVGEHVELYIE